MNKIGKLIAEVIEDSVRYVPDSMKTKVLRRRIIIKNTHKKVEVHNIQRDLSALAKTSLNFGGDL